MNKKYEIDLSLLNEIFDFNSMIVSAETPEKAIKEFMEGLCDEVESMGYDVITKIGEDYITEVLE